MNIYDHMPMQFIKYATERGIELTLEKDCINLNTGMKSQLQLYWDGVKFFVRGRYEYYQTIEDFNDLYRAIRHCDHNARYDGNGRNIVCGNLSPILDDGGFGDLDFTPFG